MANLITNTKLVNNERKLIIKYSELCDGTSATNTSTIVDVSDSAFNSMSGKAMTAVAIDRIYIFPGIGTIVADQVSGHIEWATSDSAKEVPITNIAADYQNTSGSTFDFSHFGGLTKEGDTANGDIKLDVAGMGTGQGYSFVLEMRKIYA